MQMTLEMFIREALIDEGMDIESACKIAAYYKKCKKLEKKFKKNK